MAVDDVVTITTKAWTRPTSWPAPPDEHAFPSTLVDDFESDPIGAESPYFAQMSGAFEVAPSTLRKGSTLQQRAVGFPVKWLRDDKAPFTQAGDGHWGKTSVQVDVAAISAVSVFVVIRGNFGGTDGTGLLFGVDTNRSRWFVAPTIQSAMQGAYVVSGSLATAKQGVFNTLNVSINDVAASAKGFINGVLVFENLTNISVKLTGTVVLGTSDYGIAEYDNFAARGTSEPPSPSPPSPGPAPGPPPLPPLPPKGCKPPVPGSTTLARLFACKPELNDVQRWSYTSNNTLVLRSNTATCLGISEASVSAPAPAAAATAATVGVYGQEGGGCSGKCLSVLGCSDTHTTVSEPSDSPQPIKVFPSHSKQGDCIDVDMSGSDAHAGKFPCFGQACALSTHAHAWAG